MREVNPNLVCSPGFEDLVMRCIAKDPAERYASMDEVLQAIKRAHGVSMTGQLAAVNTSGSFMPLQSDMPPPVRSSAPAFASHSGAAGTTGPRTPLHVGAVGFGGVTGTSGSHTPLGMMHADGSSDSGVGPYSGASPPRSKAWIAIGVLGAALLGGLLGLGVFRMTTNGPSIGSLTTSPPATTTTATAPATASSSSAAAPGIPGTDSTAAIGSTASPTTADARTLTIKVTTEPAGASVREDATELCASTPCDVTFKGDAADPTKSHKLVMQHAGFRPETRVLKPSDPALTSGLHVKLFRGGGGARPSQGTQTSPPATATKPPETTPNGFKDLPY
jgi:serine/threonine-protein kinase